MHFLLRWAVVWMVVPPYPNHIAKSVAKRLGQLQ